MFENGKKFFIKTVTDYFTGEVVENTDHHVILKNAAWIADTGRFSDAMKTGNFSEVEPYPDDMLVEVFTGSMVSACEWPHELPRKQK